MQAKRDENHVPTLLAVSNVDQTTPVTLYADPTTHRLLVSLSGSSAAPFPDDTALIKNAADNTKLVIISAANVTTGTTRTLTVPDANTIIVGTDTTQTLQNKTLDNTTTLTVKDANLTVQDDGDTTKQLKLQLSGITTGTTRTVTLPDANGTMTLLGNSSTGSGNIVLATSPTLTTPVLGAATATSINGLTISSSTGTLSITNGKTVSISNSLTLAGTDSTTITFQGTDTYVGRTTTDTLTNKTLTAAKIADNGFVADNNGNEQILFHTTASAVNQVEVTNAATGTTGPLIAPGGETNIDLRLSGKGTGAVHFTSGSYGDLTSDVDGATVTFNLATSNLHTVTLGGNRTLAISNAHVGQCFIIRLVQDGTGSRTVTWFTTIKWAGGVAPTLTTTAGQTDVLGFIVTSAGNYDGFVVGQNL